MIHTPFICKYIEHENKNKNIHEYTNIFLKKVYKFFTLILIYTHGARKHAYTHIQYPNLHKLFQTL